MRVYSTVMVSIITINIMVASTTTLAVASIMPISTVEHSIIISKMVNTILHASLRQDPGKMENGLCQHQSVNRVDGRLSLSI